MSLFTIKDYKRYNLISLAVQIFITGLFISVILAFGSIIFDGIGKLQHYKEFCYALFAANAILCNSLFGMGRSKIFIEKVAEQDQVIIYRSGVMFLFASICSFFLSGWIYAIETGFVDDAYFTSTKVSNWIIKLQLAIGVGVSVVFSLLGLVFFIRWVFRSLKHKLKAFQPPV